jgi:hypothetical protein
MIDHHEPDDGQYTTLELAGGHFLREEELLSDATQFVRRLADEGGPEPVDDGRTAVVVPMTDETLPVQLDGALPDRYLVADEEGDLLVERLSTEDVDRAVVETGRDRPIGTKRLIARLQDRYGPAGVHRRRLIAYLRAADRSREEAERELEQLREDGELTTTEGRRLRLD